MAFPGVKNCRRGRAVGAALSLTLFALLAGCHREGPDRPDRPVPRARRDAGVSPGAPGAVLAAPAPDTDAVLDAGSSEALERREPLPPALAACVERNRASTPPELALALNALQFQAVLEDGCRLRQAVQFSDPTLCERVTVSALRNACRARAAAAAGRPDVCPPAELERGRDPVCVALAARSPGLCAAALWADRPRCLAAAHGNASECDALDPLLRPRCRDEVEALRGALPASDARPFAAAVVRLSLGPRDPTADAGPPATPLLGTERGAFADGAGNVYVLDPLVGWPAGDVAWEHTGAPRIGLAVRPPARAGRGRLVALRLVLPDGRLFLVDPAHPAASSEADFRRGSAGRGASVSGVVTARVPPRRAEAPDAPATDPPVPLEITFHTFVRDVLDPSALGVPAEVSPPSTPADE